MAFDVLHRPEHDLVCILYSDAVDIDQRARALAESTALLQGTGARRLLIDYGPAQLVPASSDDMVQHATRVAADYRALFLLRVALVGPHASPGVTTVELIAALHGYLYQRFPSTQSAMNWLLRAAVPR